jgi:FemAB-related protein (PEP-CTERM system-associated)
VIEIRELALSETAAWDAFVRATPGATFFHLSGWKRVIDQCFGHPTYFLCARRGAVITGVLPLAQVRSVLFGNTLVSLPFCVYGGVAALDEESRSGLIEKACELALQLKTDFLELRHMQPIVDMPVVDRYVTFRKALRDDPEANMNEIPRKQRAMIRKGAAKGLVARQSDTVEVFFRIYAESLRNLGTPVLPRRFFAALKAEFGADCEVLEVKSGDEVVAAVMSFYFRDEVLPYYGGGTLKARDVHAYDFMYWELLVHALARGCRIFDFGRSRVGTGSYRFKTHWGFEPTPLPYQYQLIGARDLPNKTPDNPKYSAAINLWKRLPVPVTTLVGPWLARSLG